MKLKIIFIYCFTIISVGVFPSNKVNTNWEHKFLTDRQISNYLALNYCYGYVRYFYPNPNFEKIDWVKFLTYSVNVVDKVKTEEDLMITLNKLFSPLCPDVIFMEDSLQTISKINPPFYAVKHKGIGIYTKLFHGKNYTPISLVNDAGYDSFYCYKISDKIFIALPFAVKKLPAKTKEFENLRKEISKIEEGGINTLTFLFNRKKIQTTKFSYHKVDYRIADLIIRYNFIQHFYAYFDEDKLDKYWLNNFQTTLDFIAQTDDINNYYEKLSQYTSMVKDQHLNVWRSVNSGLSWLGIYLPTFYPDILYGFKNDTCYVEQPGENYNNQIKKGDVIVLVNNQPIKNLVEEKLSSASFSTDDAGLLKISQNGKLFESYNRDSIINITLRDKANSLYEVKLKTNLSDIPFIKEKIYYKRMDNGIYYINLCSQNSNYEQFKKLIPDLLSSKGIIFDMRGYPQTDVIPLISHFINNMIEVGNLTSPVYSLPNHQNVDYSPVEKWKIEPALSPNSKSMSKKNEYQMPVPVKIEVSVVFLINSACVSFGESIVEMIKHYKIGKLVGTPTAGCNGDITRINIPNFNFNLTYNRFSNRDGSQHHSLGVQPDYYCEKNISDIQNNIDTQLEFAKRLIADHGTITVKK